jgi:hypothetical protein
MRFMELGVVARVGIEPSTRGFSVQRRARFGASKPKTGKGFTLGRPNSRGPDPVQRLTGIATEPLPNRASSGPSGVRNSSPTSAKPPPRSERQHNEAGQVGE